MVIHTVKAFGIVNKAIDVFLELSCFFCNPTDVGNLTSGSSAFSKSILNIWKFSVYVLLKRGLENFEHYFDGMWDECNCAVVWTFFGFSFLSLGLEWKLTFSSPVATGCSRVNQQVLLCHQAGTCISIWVSAGPPGLRMITSGVFTPFCLPSFEPVPMCQSLCECVA